jgi:acetolactate synthase-1/2/3 large subunit
MTITGAKALFNRLVHNNVKYVFGYPGGAILPVLNEFHNQDKIKYILSRTEAGGSFMAEGYSKATNTHGVVMVTSGPGAINSMTSLHNALSDGTALLCLTGQVSTKVIGTDAFQEADVISISKACTKWNSIIMDGKTINNTVDKAFRIMNSNRSGPVLLDLPKNIMSAEYVQDRKIIDEEFSPLQEDVSTIKPEDINDMILQSDRPVILAGQGILTSDSVSLLREFALYHNIPVTTTLLGLGAFDEKHLLSLKMLGMHGSYYANMAVQNADLLINFGSRFDDRIIGDPAKFAPNAKIIHVDISAKNINKTIQTRYYINDSCKNVLRKINNYDLAQLNYNPYQYSKWHKTINEWKKIKFSYPNKIVLQGRQVIAALNELIYESDNKYTIVADVGAHQMWSAQFIDYNYPKVKFMTSGGLGSMGYAVPASIGVKIGRPDDTVICICGDGGFTMSMTELLTAIENKVNIKVLVINNSYQLMVKMWQEKFYNNNLVGVKMNNPPFEKVCEAFGCKGIKIYSNVNLHRKLKFMLDYNDGPIVANITTDESESVLPMVSPGKALDDMIIDENTNNQKLTGEAPC